jgi:chemotaxis protein CheD
MRAHALPKHAAPKHASPTLAAPVPAESHDPVSTNPHFLHAGQVFVSAEGKCIVLILGSCVGVCIWDAFNSIGGATHFLLPSWDGTGVASPRYGNVAISILVQRLLEAGANRGQLRAKVYGGGCLFDSMRKAGSHKEQHLGGRNVEMALETLTKAQIPVVSTVVAVDRGHRTDTGDAEMKVL